MSEPRPSTIALGVEWIVEALGCAPAELRNPAVVDRFLDDVIRALALRVAVPRVSYTFPEPGGVTALVLLTESHLAIHTFPEHGALTLNLHCCRPRGAFDWKRVLAEAFGATEVRVRELVRDLAVPHRPTENAR
jgi:S-adenosylmethionine decarboxylase